MSEEDKLKCMCIAEYEYYIDLYIYQTYKTKVYETIYDTNANVLSDIAEALEIDKIPEELPEKVEHIYWGINFEKCFQSAQTIINTLKTKFQ